MKKVNSIMTTPDELSTLDTILAVAIIFVVSGVLVLLLWVVFGGSGSDRSDVGHFVPVHRDSYVTLDHGGVAVFVCPTTTDPARSCYVTCRE